MFAEIRDTFGIAKQDDLKLSDYPTLGHIISFAEQGGSPEPDRDPSPKGPAPTGTDGKETTPQKKGEMRFLRPRLIGRPQATDCLLTGAALSGCSFIVGGDENTADALARKIRDQGGRAVRLTASDPELLVEEAKEKASQQAPDGLWILPATQTVDLDTEDDDAWQKAMDARVGLPFRLAQAMETHLANRTGAFLICGTKMGGHLGLENGGAADPVAGLTTGFVKALAREWGDTLCKVVDFPTTADAEYVAKKLMEEARIEPNLTEVGSTPQGRFGVRLEEVMMTPQQNSSWAPCADPIVLVSGGTGGIASHVCADLAAQAGGTWYLVGRTTLPTKDDADIQLLKQDRNLLKKSILERLKATGGRVTPVMVEAAIARVERGLSALNSLERIKTAGGKVHHAAVDITNTQAVSDLVKTIVERHGRLDVIIHAAGIDHSQALAKKTTDAFDRIVGVKAHGLRALLLATHNIPIRNLVLFGSIAGRFGNLAQTDYSAGNDLLAKAAKTLMSSRSDFKVLTLAYSAWAEQGMASRGTIPQMMEQAGIGMIPLKEGATSVRLSLASGQTGELVVGTRFGELEKGLHAIEMDLEKLRSRIATDTEKFPLLTEVIDWNANTGLHLEVEFDPASEPYLDHHRIEGTAVVPGVMAVESFSEAVRLIYPNPGILSVEALSFEAPLKLYRDEPRRASLYLVPTWIKHETVFQVRMETTRELKGGRSQTICHYRAHIQVHGRQESPARMLSPARENKDMTIKKQAIYDFFFHGPSFQVLEQANTADDGSLAGHLDSDCKNPAMSKPSKMTSSPMLTELAFQTAGLLEARNHDRLGLPAGVEKLSIHNPQPGDPGKIVAWVVDKSHNDEGRYSAKVVDERGYILVELDGYRTSSLPGGLPEQVQSGLNPEKNSF
jgi:NAD(P)-dependent dehydrogenase (short-subunit alcohol dehydrogenase family)